MFMTLRHSTSLCSALAILGCVTLGCTAEEGNLGAVPDDALSGTVMYDGATVSGVKVSVAVPNTLEFVDQADTDNGGRFSFGELASDSYVLIASYESGDASLFKILDVTPGSNVIVDLQRDDVLDDENVGEAASALCSYTTYYGLNAYTCQFCDGNDPDIDTGVTFGMNEQFFGWNISHNIAARTLLGSTILTYHKTLLVNKKGISGGKYIIETVMGDWWKYFSLTSIRDSLKVSNIVLCQG